MTRGLPLTATDARPEAVEAPTYRGLPLTATDSRPAAVEAPTSRGLPAADGWPAAFADARRIVAFRLDGLGDLLMTTPALRALATSRAGTHLTLVTSPAAEPAARMLPFVDEVLVYDAPWVKATRPRSGPGADRAFIDRLGSARYDAAVVFTVHTQNPLPAAMAAYLAGIPLRLAYCRENPYQLLTHRIPEPEVDGPTRHEVVRQLELVAAAGFAADDGDDHLTLRVPPDAVRRMRALLGESGLAAGLAAGSEAPPWALVHPGATAPSRRYAPDRLAEAAAILRGLGWRVVVAGGPDDAAASEMIAEASGGLDLSGRLSFAELAALIALAPIAILNNSGPMHVAAALGTPVVALYALTNLQHTPWRVASRVLSHDVPCAGCLKSVCPLETQVCLDVPPPDVAEAAVDLLAEVARGGCNVGASSPRDGLRPLEAGPRAR